MSNLKDIVEVDVTIQWSPTDYDNASRRAELYSTRQRIKQICGLYGGRLEHVVDATIGFIFGSLESAERAANDLRSAADLRLKNIDILRFDVSEVHKVAVETLYWHLTAVKRFEDLGLSLGPEMVVEAKDFWPIDIVSDVCAKNDGKLTELGADGGWVEVHYEFDQETQACAAQEVLEGHGFGVDVHVHSCAKRMLG